MSMDIYVILLNAYMYIYVDIEMLAYTNIYLIHLYIPVYIHKYGCVHYTLSKKILDFFSNPSFIPVSLAFKSGTFISEKSISFERLLCKIMTMITL